MQKVLIVEGEAGKGRLADAIGRTTRTIERYLAGICVPSQRNAHKLAKACGLSDGEARRLITERSPARAKESSQAVNAAKRTA